VKVCLITSSYKLSQTDTNVPFLVESVSRLRERGVEVHVFAPSYEGLQSHVLDGVPIHRFRYFARRWEHLTHFQGAPNRLRNPLYLVAAGTSGRAAPLVLPPGVPIYVAGGEDGALVRAAADLARDLAAVLSAPSPVVRERSAIAGRPAIVLTTQRYAQAGEADPRLQAPESHATWIQVVSGQPRVVLKGADTRGAICAAYTFSDEILDVPPLAFWASMAARQTAGSRHCGRVAAAGRHAACAVARGLPE
jgi:hypothetical protein